MIYDYSKLERRIAERFINKAEFAELIGISEPLLSLKMSNKIAFTQRDIQKVSNVLKICDNEISTYFFILNIQNIEQ